MYDAQEQYNKKEKEYVEARLEYTQAKNRYELEKAKTHTLFKTKALSAGDKPTIEDLRYQILIQQANSETDLGKAFVNLANFEAKKQRTKVELNSAERAYWEEARVTL